MSSETDEYRRGVAALYRLAGRNAGTPLGDAARNQADEGNWALAHGGVPPVKTPVVKPERQA